jgi:hypothetical protein
MQNRERIIQNYIEGYNASDIDEMVKDLDEAILFENISNGEINMSLTGLKAFKLQAEQAKGYFSVREQTIKAFRHQNENTEIEIEYYAILAMDFPNGLKKGDELKLQGRSIFQFSGNKITKLTDIS